VLNITFKINCQEFLPPYLVNLFMETVHCANCVVKWYDARGEYSENRIKELKIGFSMERMPSSNIICLPPL